LDLKGAYAAIGKGYLLERFVGRLGVFGLNGEFEEDLGVVEKSGDRLYPVYLV
jgi:hypothetical protein